MALTHRRRLELLRAISAGERSLGAPPGDDAAYAKLLARFAEWEELEALGDVTLKVIRERMTSEGRIYNAVALITPEGSEFLEDHADEFDRE